MQNSAGVSAFRRAHSEFHLRIYSETGRSADDSRGDRSDNAAAV